VLARLFRWWRHCRPGRLAREHHRRGHPRRAGSGCHPARDSAAEREPAAERRSFAVRSLHPRQAGVGRTQSLRRARGPRVVPPLRSLRAGPGQDRARARAGRGRRCARCSIAAWSTAPGCGTTSRRSSRTCIAIRPSILRRSATPSTRSRRAADTLQRTSHPRSGRAATSGSTRDAARAGSQDGCERSGRPDQRPARRQRRWLCRSHDSGPDDDGE